MLIERLRFFDKDTSPKQPLEAEKPEPVEKLARRRNYAHTFSAGRKFKLVRGANGHQRWRRLPDGAIVHYGKNQRNTDAHKYSNK